MLAYKRPLDIEGRLKPLDLLPVVEYDDGWRSRVSQEDCALLSEQPSLDRRHKRSKNLSE